MSKYSFYYDEYIFPQIGYGEPISRQKAGNRRL